MKLHSRRTCTGLIVSLLSVNQRVCLSVCLCICVCVCDSSRRRWPTTAAVKVLRWLQRLQVVDNMSLRPTLSDTDDLSLSVCRRHVITDHCTRLIRFLAYIIIISIIIIIITRSSSSSSSSQLDASLPRVISERALHVLVLSSAASFVKRISWRRQCSLRWMKRDICPPVKFVDCQLCSNAWTWLVKEMVSRDV